jgi:hypothetical protein
MGARVETVDDQGLVIFLLPPSAAPNAWQCRWDGHCISSCVALGSRRLSCEYPYLCRERGGCSTGGQ